MTPFIVDIGLNNFRDFKLTLTIIGDHTELTVFDIILYGFE